jgi:hypothetical protein
LKMHIFLLAYFYFKNMFEIALRSLEGIFNL